MLLTLIVALSLRQQSADPRLIGAARKDLSGWIQLKLAGKPRDIGYQYGFLAAREIDDAQRARRSQIHGEYDWNWYRKTAKDLFWPKVDREYQEELAGQAEGLQAKGFKEDVWDVLAYNANIELGDYYIPWLRAQKTGQAVRGTRESCSAFIANGKCTKDGQIVMGHNLWWDYLMGERANVLLDITPEKGNRIVMDAFCGFIHSGTDFGYNAAGMTLCETTIDGFAGFDPKGTPEFVRMRKALQYAESTDDMVRIFKEGNNGGYANTWLIGDTKKNEIAKLELGLKHVNLWRSLDGYYVGSNFPEDPKLIEDEIPGGWDANPQINGCETRRQRWNQLIQTNQGKIDSDLARIFLGDTYDINEKKEVESGSVLCGKGGGGGACNAKVVDAAMVKAWSIWARFGVPDGSPKPLASQGSYYKDIPSWPWERIKL